MCPYNCFLWFKNSQQFLAAICYSKTVLSEDHKKYFNYVSLIPLQPTFLILRHTLSPWNRYNIKVAFESCRSLRFNLVNIRGLPSRFVEIYLRVLSIYLGDSIDSRALNFVRWFRLELRHIYPSWKVSSQLSLIFMVFTFLCCSHWLL